MSTGESWKELTERMVDAVGARKDVAKLLGVSQNDISQWCNPDHPRVIPLDHAVDLNAMSGDILLQKLARDRGFELVPLKERPVDTEAAMQAAADLSKDSGELVHDVYQASQDGISPREARELRGRMGQVFNRLHELDGALA